MGLLAAYQTTMDTFKKNKNKNITPMPRIKHLHKIHPQ